MAGAADLGDLSTPDTLVGTDGGGQRVYPGVVGGGV